MSFFGFFKKVAVKVSGVFVKIFGSDAAKAFGGAALNLLKSELGKIAVSVVLGLQALPGSNAEKRDAALNLIKEQAVNSGIQVKDSLVSLVLEVAVNFIKGHFIPE